MFVQSTKDFGTNRLKFLIYGPPGSGKTSLAKTCGQNVCIISAEGGLLSIKDQEIDFIDISKDDDGNVISTELRFDRFSKAIKFLMSKEAKAKYKWIFIDSLTEISQNLVEYLKKKYPDKKDAFPMWGEYSDRMREMIKVIRDIDEYNVVFTALSVTEKDESQRRFTAIDVQGRIATQLPGYFDEVFYTLVAESEQNREFTLVTGGTEKLVCKDRSGKLLQIEKPNLAMVASKITGEAKHV